MDALKQSLKGRASAKRSAPSPARRSTPPPAAQEDKPLGGAGAEGELSFSPRHCKERKRRSNP